MQSGFYPKIKVSVHIFTLYLADVSCAYHFLFQSKNTTSKDAQTDMHAIHQHHFLNSSKIINKDQKDRKKNVQTSDD